MKRAFLRFTGLLLVLASIPKLRHPAVFLTALQGYQLFPAWSLKFLNFYLPALELVVGISLLWRCSKAGMLWALVLFASFLGALSWARFHRLSLTCGCFGRLDSWLHHLPHGLALHILGVLGMTVGLALLTREALRVAPGTRLDQP